MQIGDVDIQWVGHATFRLTWKGLTVYIDPYVLENDPPKADLILITHDHFDHCDREAVRKLLKGDTHVVAAGECNPARDTIKVRPGDFVEWKGIGVEAVPAYNIGKPFHPKDKNYVGYLVRFGKVTVYHAGDTDLIPEMEQLAHRVTVALLPIGGTYTMDEREAAEAVKIIKPTYVIPMHYNYLEGLEKDPTKFKELVKDSEVIILEPLVSK